ncbi:MAG: threonine-phosphate decarboxylase [Oscillospiraceae bacterium]
MGLIHGGDIHGFYEENGYMPLDFSANINPLGLPESVRAAIGSSADLLCSYPDPLCRELRNAIAVREGVCADEILCANGAADIIFRLANGLKPKKALVLAPTFAEYELALHSSGCEVRYHELFEKNDFALTDSILSEITDELDILFICEPNNPTGQLSDRELLLKIAEKCESCNVIFVCDECFNDFLDEPNRHTLKPILSKTNNLVILKAFTKIYAMAGLRLGYCLCSNSELLSRLRGAAQPWSVSSIAQIAGVAAVCETEYIQKTHELIKAERAFLKTSLSELGLCVTGSNANYIFMKSDCVSLDVKLRSKGILIRSCANYRGLADGYYRAAVRTHSENEKLVAAIKEVTEN